MPHLSLPTTILLLLKAHSISKIADLRSKLGALKQDTGWDQILDALRGLEQEGAIEFTSPERITLTEEGHRRALAHFA